MLSAELGAVKPTREAFDRAAERCGVRPGQLLLVDDSIGNVEGARAAGWEAIPFEDAAVLAARAGRSGRHIWMTTRRSSVISRTA